MLTDDEVEALVEEVTPATASCKTVLCTDGLNFKVTTSGGAWDFAWLPREATAEDITDRIRGLVHNCERYDARRAASTDEIVVWIIGR